MAVIDAATTRLLPAIQSQEATALVTKVARALQGHMLAAQNPLDTQASATAAKWFACYRRAGCSATWRGAGIGPRKNDATSIAAPSTREVVIGSAGL